MRPRLTTTHMLLLEFLSHEGGTASLESIAAALDVPVATVEQLWTDLADAGMIAPLGTDN